MEGTSADDVPAQRQPTARTTTITAGCSKWSITPSRIHGLKRAPGLDVQANGSSNPHPFPYAKSPPPANYSCNPPTATCAGVTHYFQYQTFTQRPNYRRVEIPRFDYDFWKQAAIAGRGQRACTTSPTRAAITRTASLRRG